MNGYLAIILIILSAGYLLDLVVGLLTIRSLDPRLPPEFTTVFDPDRYRQSQRYTRARTRFHLIREGCGLLALVWFILAGGFRVLDQWTLSFGLSPVPTGLLFIAAFLVLAALFQLPFSVYSTFVIEARFNMNRTTVATFLLDLLKSLFLAVALGGPLLALVLWFFAHTPLAWLWSWLLVTLFMLVMQVVAPVLLLPLFNRFTPLPEGELRDLITGYVRDQGFGLAGIYTMDGSRRSARVNAFFTGLGRFRRIVFFDTLVEALSPREILAVLAHELGHFRRRHILRLTLLHVGQTGLMLFLLSLFIDSPGLAAAFGLDQPRIHTGLGFFSFLYGPVSALLTVVTNFYSRRFEFEADGFAVESTGLGPELAMALKKLCRVNLSNLTPHPVQVFLEYSHPPVLERIRRLDPEAGSNGAS